MEETLAGRQEALSQAAIATRVFARRDDFDPTVDPIVRIQAGRLRRSLERYYLLAGKGDGVRVELPRGSYVPTLRFSAPGEGLAQEQGAPPAGLSDDAWPALVVGPFEGRAADAELDSGADIVQQRLTGELGRYGDVRVFAKADLDRLGPPALGRRYFELSGRLSRGPAGLQLTAQLVDRGTAQQIWAEEYNGPPDASAAFYEGTAHIIAARVASENGVVARHLWAELRRRPPEELTPYGAILRSYTFFFNRDPVDFAPAVEALQRTVEAEPECGLAWVQLARLYCVNYAFEVAPLETPIAEAVRLAHNGVRIEATSPRARGMLAFALLLKGELAAAGTEAQKALEMNPDSLVYLESIGWLMTLLGDWERGPALVRRAIARNPHHLPLALHALWIEHLHRGEYEQAYEAALLYSDPAFFWRALIRACCLGHLGRRAEAGVEIADLLQAKPDFGRRGRLLIGRLIRLPDLFERVVDGLAKAGLELA